MEQQYFRAEFVFDEDLHGSKTYCGSAMSCMQQLNADIRNNVIPGFTCLVSLTSVQVVEEK